MEILINFNELPVWLPRFGLIGVLLFLAWWKGKEFNNFSNKSTIRCKGFQVSNLPIIVLWWAFVFFIVGWIWTTNPAAVTHKPEKETCVNKTSHKCNKEDKSEIHYFANPKGMIPKQIQKDEKLMDRYSGELN